MPFLCRWFFFCLIIGHAFCRLNCVLLLWMLGNWGGENNFAIPIYSLIYLDSTILVSRVFGSGNCERRCCAARQKLDTYRKTSKWPKRMIKGSRALSALGLLMTSSSYRGLSSWLKYLISNSSKFIEQMIRVIVRRWRWSQWLAREVSFVHEILLGSFY